MPSRAIPCSPVPRAWAPGPARPVPGMGWAVPGWSVCWAWVAWPILHPYLVVDQEPSWTNRIFLGKPRSQLALSPKRLTSLPHGNHGSNRTEVDSPLPMRCIIFLIEVSPVDRIPLQPQQRSMGIFRFHKCLPLMCLLWTQSVQRNDACPPYPSL